MGGETAALRAPGDEELHQGHPLVALGGLGGGLRGVCALQRAGALQDGVEAKTGLHLVGCVLRGVDLVGGGEGPHQVSPLPHLLAPLRRQLRGRGGQQVAALVADRLHQLQQVEGQVLVVRQGETGDGVLADALLREHRLQQLQGLGRGRLLPALHQPQRVLRLRLAAPVHRLQELGKRGRLQEEGVPVLAEDDLLLRGEGVGGGRGGDAVQLLLVRAGGLQLSIDHPWSQVQLRQLSVLLLHQVRQVHLGVPDAAQLVGGRVRDDLLSVRLEVDHGEGLLAGALAEGGELHGEVEVVGGALLLLVDPPDLREGDPVQPVDVLDVSFVVLPLQVAQSLRLAARVPYVPGGGAAVVPPAGLHPRPQPQVHDPRVARAPFIEHWHRSAAQRRVPPRALAVPDSQRQHRLPGQVSAGDGQSQPLAPLPDAQPAEALVHGLDRTAEGNAVVEQLARDGQVRTVRLVYACDRERRVFY